MELDDILNEFEANYVVCIIYNVHVVYILHKVQY